MISDDGLLNTLTELDVYYNSAGTSSEGQICASKLALLELCGWVEEAIDSVFVSYVISSEISSIRKDEFINELERVFGIGVKKLNAIAKLAIGAHGLSIIDGKMDMTGDMDILCDKLKLLKGKRDLAAHRSISGTMDTYSAPSDIKNEFAIIKSTLERLEECLFDYLDEFFIK